MKRSFFLPPLVFLLSACKPLQRSPLFTIEEAPAVLGLNIAYDLNYSFDQGLNFQELTIKADKARFIPSTIIGAREHRICPTATGLCRVEIYRVVEGDSILLDYSEYKVIVPQLEAHLKRQSGSIKMSRAEVQELIGLRTRFTNGDFDARIRAVYYEVHSTIRGKKVVMKARGDRFPSDVRNLLRYKDLKQFTITNIAARYGCDNEKHTLEDIVVEVVD